MFSNKWTAFLMVVGPLFLLLAACNKPRTPPEPINIGVINSLTGRFDSFGVPVQKGIEMAVEEINAKGGVNGHTLKLLVEDDASNNDRAVKAFEKFANESKVAVVIGPLSSGASIATMPLANKYQVVQIAPIAGDPALTTSDDYVFRLYTNEEISARDIVKFATERFKAKRVAVLNEDTKYGAENSRRLRENFAKVGAQVVADERFAQNDKGFRSQLARLFAGHPDLLIYPSLFLEQSLEITKEISQIVQGPSIPNMVVGTACLQTFDTVSYPANVFFLNETFGTDQTANRTMQDFITGYRQRNSTMPTPFVAAGHASVNVVKTALQKGGVTGAQIKSALHSVDDETALGRVKFDSTGGNTGIGYSLYQLKGKQLVLAQ